jgi:WD40 repeat protein
MSGETLTCSSPSTTPHNPLLGKRLDGRYHIVDTLARGGFSQTYIASDTRRPGQPKCVVKHLQPLIQDEDGLREAERLFNQEAEILEQLGCHDQIPRLLAHFEENQAFYLVQEFIEGQSLGAELQAGESSAKCHKPWNVDQAIQLLQELLDILQFIHAHQFIHRDIKPDNIIRRQSDNKFVLVDFGAGKLLSTTGQPYTRTTIISSGVYTPPEQMEGNPRPCSDLYALGMTIIQALTGLTPEALHQHRDLDTGEINFQYLIPGNEPLKALLSKMVRYYFKERYQTATEALQALQAIIHASDDQPVQQSPIPAKLTSGYTPTSLILPTKHPAVQPVISEQAASKVATVDRPTTNRTTSHSPKPEKTPLPSLNFTPTKSTQFATRIKSFNTTIDSWIAIGMNRYRRTSIIHQSALAITAGTTLLITPLAFLSLYSSTSTPTPIVQTQDPLLNTLTEHRDAVRSIAFSADGKLLASGSDDSTLKVWDLKTQQPILNKQLTGEILSIALSSDNRTLASSGTDRTIKLWNLQTGELTHSLSEHAWQMNSIAFTADNQKLVGGSQDGAIGVWDLASKKLVRTLSKDASRVHTVAISPDNSLLASSSGDYTIKLWDLSTGKSLPALKGHSAPVNSLAIDPDSTILASGSADGTIKLWNLYTGELIRTLDGHLGEVYAVTFSPDGQTIVSGGKDYTVRTWNLWTGQNTHTFQGHTNVVHAVAFSPNGQTIASSSEDTTIKLWQLPNQ